jgi:hypothetical protein
LQVRWPPEGEVLKDIVRVAKPFRDGIPNLTICRISVGAKSAVVLLRGWDADPKKPQIAIDEALRERLGIVKGESYDFVFQPMNRFGQFLWFLQASDPSIRLNSWLAMISLLLGLAGLAIGLASCVASDSQRHDAFSTQRNTETR